MSSKKQMLGSVMNAGYMRMLNQHHMKSRLNATPKKVINDITSKINAGELSKSKGRELLTSTIYNYRRESRRGK